MNKRLVISGFGLVAIIALGFFLLNSNSGKQKYLTEDVLPDWTVRGVQKTADHLFESFKITATHRSPQINEIFPNLEMKDLDGRPISLRERTTVLVIGDNVCSSCKAIIDATKTRTDIQIVKLIPYGMLPEKTEKSIRYLSTRQNPENHLIFASPKQTIKNQSTQEIQSNPKQTLCQSPMRLPT